MRRSDCTEGLATPRSTCDRKLSGHVGHLGDLAQGGAAVPARAADPPAELDLLCVPGPSGLRHVSPF